MIISRIIEEFIDYSRYVHHTLCKNQFYLSLSASSEEAKRCFSDPSVWPILKQEALRLFDLSTNLFGLSSPFFKGEAKITVQRYINKIESLGQELITRNDSSYKQLVNAANKLRDFLSEVPERINDKSCSFNKERIEEYLKGKGAKEYWDLVTNLIEKKLLPSFKRLIFSDDSEVSEAYELFWKKFPEIRIATRVCIVASAFEENDCILKSAENLKKMLFIVEEISYCWGISLDRNSRSEEINHILERYGLDSLDSLVKTLENLK